MARKTSLNVLYATSTDTKPLIPAGAVIHICGRIGYYYGEETVIVDYDPETKLISNPRFPLDVKKSGRVQQRK
jgi:hypothetical protein